MLRKRCDVLVVGAGPVGLTAGLHPDLTFRSISIGEKGDYNDINHDFHELYGIERGGAVLVRPDGHVYWRSVNPIP